MFKRICLALTLLTGCREAKAPPSEPGTSVPLTYPVVLIGQSSVSVRDDLASLTSSTLASGLNFIELKILDSAGSIYEVRNATVLGDVKPWWLDLGTSQRVYFLELEKQRKASLDTAKTLVIEQIQSPQGVWQGDARAIGKVRGFKTVAELIDGCRTSWDWIH